MPKALIVATSLLSVGTVASLVICIRGGNPLLVISLMTLCLWSEAWFALAWWLDHVRAEERLRAWLRSSLLPRVRVRRRKPA